jgi:Uma2 family endonuclease
MEGEMRATVRTDRFISDAELYRIGEDNPGWNVERIDGGVEMSPTNTWSGVINARLTGALLAWGDRHGYLALDSSTGVKLPNNDVLCPDGALISLARWNGASEEAREGYSPLVPDLIVELASPSDVRLRLREKCRRWLRDGVTFVVMIDPEDGTVETWGTPLPDMDIDWEFFARRDPAKG